MPGWGRGGRPKGEHWPPGKNKPKPLPPSDPPPEGSGSYDDEYSEDYDRLTDANP